MSDRCGPTSQCKTIRCVCKKNNRPCKLNCSTCKCNSDICTNLKFDVYQNNDSDNEEDGCNCTSSNCADNRCGCKKSNNICNKACNCSRNCKNKNSSILHKSESDSEEDIKNKSSAVSKANGKIDLSIIDIASEITNGIKSNKSLSSIRDDVFEFRDNIDVYSGVHKNKVTEPHVDHVIECQILGHAAARVLKSKNHQPFLDSLKNSVYLESLDNYNVTFSQINTSKGSIIRNYLRDNYYRGLPLRAAITSNSTNIINKYQVSILKLMDETYPVVVNFLESDECRRNDGHATGSKTFAEIATELCNIMNEMDLNENSERRLRKK
jgi:hypothetical protein